MTKLKKGKKYALIAAICYAIDVILSIISWIGDIILSIIGWIGYVEYDHYPIMALDVVSIVIFWSIWIGFAVTLFMEKMKALIFLVGAYVLYYICNTAISGIIFYFPNLIRFFAYGALFVVVGFALNGSSAVRKLWVLPSAVMMLQYILHLIFVGNPYYMFGSWSLMIRAIVEVAALVFVGLWLKENVTSSATTSASGSVLGGADKLKMYKELFDSGAITKEEFEAKKKQILGL